MPSFRASLAILEARPGVPPESVLETARAAVAAIRVVEDAFVDVQPLLRDDGIPRIVVRFLEPAGNDAEEDSRAWQAATAMDEATRQVADVVGLRAYRRAGGRWLPLPAPEPGW